MTGVVLLATPGDDGELVAVAFPDADIARDYLTRHPTVRPVPLSAGTPDCIVRLVTRHELAGTCWCLRGAEYVLPVDPYSSTTPTGRMTDGSPGLLVCADHVDRDGFEAWPA